MISVKLFHYCEKVFTHTWMIGKNLMKHYCLKKVFSSHLNMEDITDADYVHTKKIYRYFEIKNLGEYHDLYVQVGTLLLANIFENF